MLLTPAGASVLTLFLTLHVVILGAVVVIIPFLLAFIYRGVGNLRKTAKKKGGLSARLFAREVVKKKDGRRRKKVFFYM